MATKPETTTQGNKSIIQDNRWERNQSYNHLQKIIAKQKQEIASLKTQTTKLSAYIEFNKANGMDNDEELTSPAQLRRHLTKLNISMAHAVIIEMHMNICTQRSDQNKATREINQSQNTIVFEEEQYHLIINRIRHHNALAKAIKTIIESIEEE
eukprot:535931_1